MIRTTLFIGTPAAALLVPAGWMADRFGRERIFASGIGFFTVGSGIVAWSPSIGVLIFGRVIQAVGLVFETSSSLPILLVWRWLQFWFLASGVPCALHFAAH